MRTLLAEPRALLLDEPFNRLDAALRGEIRAFVFDHARERRLPALLVTHDVADAEAAGRAGDPARGDLSVDRVVARTRQARCRAGCTVIGRARAQGGVGFRGDPETSARCGTHGAPWHGRCDLLAMNVQPAPRQAIMTRIGAPFAMTITGLLA